MCNPTCPGGGICRRPLFLKEGDFVKFFRFGIIVTALLCILMVSAFAVEPDYTYEFNSDIPPEYITISYDGDTILVYIEDAFFENNDTPREVGLQLLSQFDWVLSVNGAESDDLVFDWSVGSFTMKYSDDGEYSIVSTNDSVNMFFRLNIVRVPASSDSASVSDILSVASDVFAAVLGLVALLAAAFAVHPILLIGVVFGFLGVAIAIFRRLFV